jgi:arabinofuranosyltransferase
MDRRSRIIIAVVLAVAAAGLVVHALQYPFITDDAYISFRYSHNLAYHNQLTFNLGERVEGYTNFLWTVLLGLLLKLNLRPDVMARVLGAACGVAVLLLVTAISRVYRGGRATGWDLLAALLLPAMAPFAIWCSGGLETQLFTALIIGGVALYLAEHAGRVRWRLSGLLFALAAMTRPEGLMFFGLTGLHLLGANLLGERRLRPRLAELGWLAGFVVPFGLFFLWRYSYYGYPFPNTYYIKAAGGAASAAKWGLPYLWDFVRENRLYVLLALLPLFRPRTTWSPAEAGSPASSARGLRPVFLWSYVALLVVPFCAYVVLVGGDFMAMGRFLVPVLPLCALFAQEALRELVEWPGGRRAPDRWRPARFAVVAALLLGLLSANSVALHRESRKLGYRRWGLDTVAYLDRFARDRILIGAWMRRNLPRDTYLAVGGAGAIVYASRLRALDTFGLNDAWIAHQTPPSGDRPGHTKSAPDDYLLKQRPDLMCHIAKHQDVPFTFPDPHWRQRGYRWVCLDPPGLRPAYYCCLKRLDRDLGPLFPREVGS